MKLKTFYMISLGCAKNTVDSDAMTQLLNHEGYRPVENPLDAKVLIVNTCGFIEAARKESYQVLGEMANLKQKGQLLIAAGCLTQRYGAEVIRRVPGIDGVLGTRRWMDIVEVVVSLREEAHPRPLCHLPAVDTIGQDTRGAVLAHIQGASAYIKIADGCRRACAYCAIPLIKGTSISRPLEDVVQEALYLQKNGVREINLIAQDTTDYGHDLGIKEGLAKLLEKLALTLPSVDWIRVLYAFPGA
ncbi:MAG: radical SAM protein, partial [Chloroflexota bacterium]|nr:radical SAM protein [Chloroflexota bacterium]